MWRFAMFLLLLALLSAGLNLASQSAAASGLAAMLSIAFVGLSAVVLALGMRRNHSHTVA